jgi:uncharacterized phiE125 gp8 family phage protein
VAGGETCSPLSLKDHAMSLLLTLPPAVEPISLVEAKAHLRVDHAADDVFISALIVAARRQIEARTSLCLIQQNWSVFFDRWPAHPALSIPLDPLIAVNEVVIYGDADAASTIEPAHYFVDRAQLPARVILRQGRTVPQPGRIANGIEVKVTAGFGATAASVPQDIKQALLLTVGAWFANRGEERGGDLPLMAVGLIRPYRTVRLT